MVAARSLAQADSSLRRRKTYKPRVTLTPECERIIRAEWATRTTRQLAAETGASPESVNKWARALGLPAHPRGKVRQPRTGQRVLPTRPAAPAAQIAPNNSPGERTEAENLDAILAIYGRPNGVQVPPLPPELVAQLNTLTLAVVRETVVSLVRETVAQLTPPLIEHAAKQAIADYTSNIVVTLVGLIGQETRKQ